MKYLFMAVLGILAGCADYPLDVGEVDYSGWQLRELRREQQQVQGEQWAEHAYEQNQLNQIRMDQERFNNYGFH